MTTPLIAAHAFRDAYFRLFPDESARQLESLDPKEAAALVVASPLELGARVLERLQPEMAAAVLESLDAGVARPLLPLVEPARLARVWALLGEESRSAYRTGLSTTLAREVDALMSYPADRAGYLMDSRVPVFRPEESADEALIKVRGLRRRALLDLYVIDAQGRLLGAVSLAATAAAEPEQKLQELEWRRPVAVHAMASREEVVELLERHRLASLPVVDSDEKLLGVIRHDALVAAAQQEAASDLVTMVGASPEERALSKVSFAVKKRLPWLTVNLATAFLASSVVGLFEDMLSKFTVLAILLPVAAGQSGNTGAQAQAITMRGLALREVRVRHWFRILTKEATVGLLNGLAIGIMSATAISVGVGSYGLAAVVGLSMVVAMTAASLAGATIPILLTALGQDPAQSSSIILTTITDVVGFFSFLGLATLLSSWLVV